MTETKLKGQALEEVGGWIPVTDTWTVSGTKYITIGNIEYGY